MATIERERGGAATRAYSVYVLILLMLGLVTSLLVIDQSVVGFGMGPLLVGVIGDALTPRLGSEALRYAMLFAPCMILLAWGRAYAAWRHMSDDITFIKESVA